VNVSVKVVVANVVEQVEEAVAVGMNLLVLGSGAEEVVDVHVVEDSTEIDVVDRKCRRLVEHVVVVGRVLVEVPERVEAVEFVVFAVDTSEGIVVCAERSGCHVSCVLRQRWECPFPSLWPY